MPPKSKKKKAAAKRKSISSKTQPDITLKKRKVSKKTQKASEELLAKNTLALELLSGTGMVTTTLPNNKELELRVADNVLQCDNMNITKRAGRGKVQHLFVLPGHLEILQFANKSSRGKRASQSSQLSQQLSQKSMSQPDMEDGGNDDGTEGTKTAAAIAAAIAEPIDPFQHPDCFGSVTDLGTGNPVVYFNIPNKKGRLKLTGTIINPNAPLMALQLPSNKSKDGTNINCEATFSSIIVFNQIAWVEDVEKEEESSSSSSDSSSSSSSASSSSSSPSSSSSSSSSSSPTKLIEKETSLPKMDAPALGPVQTKFDLRSIIMKPESGEEE